MIIKRAIKARVKRPYRSNNPFLPIKAYPSYVPARATTPTIHEAGHLVYGRGAPRGYPGVRCP
jgi:hypothetical protein